MQRNAFFAFLLFALANSCAYARSVPRIEAFPPASGKGTIVIVVSGASGPELYRDYSARLAQLGYYAVLVNGNDILIRSGADGVMVGAANLRTVISESQKAPEAIAGKVALVGFSIGGGGVLRHGASQKDLVSAVVAYYPSITRAGPDYTGPASEMWVPILILAGEQDRYNNCCLAESMRSLEQAAKARGASLELVIYPDADHGFNLATPAFRAADSEDAWARAKAFLNRLQPPH
jgi:carboxymethylenebutenolidase